MRYPGFIALGFVLVAAGLAGCMVPHNDVLLFGTQTKLAVDVSAAPEQGGVPELTVGYKRKEAVWMPLYVNADESSLTGNAGNALAGQTGANSQPASPEPALFVPVATDADTANRKVDKGIVDSGKYTGTSESPEKFKQGTDTYSVFASFGADIGAGTEESGVGLAQFFATGIAAQRLGQNERVVSALALQSADQNTLDEARSRADDNLSRALSAEERLAATEAAKARITEEDAMITMIIKGVTTDEGAFDATALGKYVDALPDEKVDPTVRQKIKNNAVDADSLRAELIKRSRSIPHLFEAIYEKQS